MLDPFYVLVDSSDWLARLLPSGVRAAQLRIKDAAPEKLKAEIERASALCDRHGAQLVINDHWQEAMDAGCDYVHLGQQDLDHADIHALRRAGVRFGVSTHDHQELDRALSLEPDYIAFGPIYDTVGKDLPFAPQGLERLKLWRELAGGYPLVAIGGITLERAPDLLKAGADSVAVISDVLAAPDPEARARAFIEATRAFA
jgi:thiamine-phosphate pyrophosphorylase